MSNKIINQLKNIFSLDSFYFFFLTILLFVEIKFFTAWRNDLPPKNGIFAFLGLQLLIAILPFFGVKNKEVLTLPKRPINFLQLGPLSILSVLALIYCFNLSTPLFDKFLIQPSNGDILPQIQRFNRELLAGRFPYTIFGDFGWTMTPTYLPAQWLPYLPSIALKFDARFITFGIFSGTFLFFLWSIIRQNFPFLKALTLLVFPIFLYVGSVEFDQNIIAVTVEMLILSYYLLLSLSLTTASRGFQILTLILCLMSRFSLVFWLPLYLFIRWTKEGFRSTLRFSLWIFAGCALIYGPFLAIDPYIFANSQAYYDIATAAAWTNTPDSEHLINGFSFVPFFLKKGCDVAQNMAIMKKMMLIVTPSVSVVLGLIWWRIKDKIDSVLFSLCALKISLAVFYSLIQFPFTYLYVTPIIISLAVLYRFTMLQKNKIIN